MSTNDEGQSVSPNDAKPLVSSSTGSCPNFPYFGASYPDAGRKDGYAGYHSESVTAKASKEQYLSSIK